MGEGGGEGGKTDLPQKKTTTGIGVWGDRFQLKRKKKGRKKEQSKRIQTCESKRAEGKGTKKGKKKAGLKGEGLFFWGDFGVLGRVGGKERI